MIEDVEDLARHPKPHNRHYVLEGHTPRREPDGEKWFAWFATADRGVRVSRTEDYIVSTVFTGYDQSCGSEPEPVLFETVTFPLRGGKAVMGRAAVEARTRTWDEALEAHRDVLERLREKIPHERRPAWAGSYWPRKKATAEWPRKARATEEWPRKKEKKDVRDESIGQNDRTEETTPCED